jgi:pyridoxine 5-phosphate synthase
MHERSSVNRTLIPPRRCCLDRLLHEVYIPLRRLLINIDHVATLRNARREHFPDPVHAAAVCEAAGAHGIVFHLREDRRHITERDVRLLKETVRGKLDFELSMDPEVVGICCEVKPQLATLVPERREEITTESGLDVAGHSEQVSATVSSLLDAEIEEVALFIDADLKQVDAALEAGANAVEFHTGVFAEARTSADQLRELTRLQEAARYAAEAGLHVHAGHGLDYNNTDLFLRHVPHVEEVSIGFAIVARAILVGMDCAVRDMRRLVDAAPPYTN